MVSLWVEFLCELVLCCLVLGLTPFLFAFRAADAQLWLGELHLGLSVFLLLVSLCTSLLVNAIA